MLGLEMSCEKGFIFASAQRNYNYQLTMWASGWECDISYRTRLSPSSTSEPAPSLRPGSSIRRDQALSKWTSFRYKHQRLSTPLSSFLSGYHPHHSVPFRDVAYHKASRQISFRQFQ